MSHFGYILAAFDVLIHKMRKQFGQRRSNFRTKFARMPLLTDSIAWVQNDPNSKSAQMCTVWEQFRQPIFKLKLPSEGRETDTNFNSNSIENFHNFPKIIRNFDFSHFFIEKIAIY